MSDAETKMLEQIRRDGHFVTTIDSGGVRILMAHLRRRGLVVGELGADGQTVWTLQ